MVGKIEQGDLFGMPDKEKERLSDEKPIQKPTERRVVAPKIISLPSLQKPLTYADYLKLFCGDKTLAHHYYVKNNPNLKDK